MYHHYFSTPKGFPRPFIHITADHNGIIGVDFVNQINEKERKNAHTEQCIKELQQYFNGERDNFSVILNPSGTHFHKRVWQQLGEIPYGQCWSYKELAIVLGSANFCRAVGMANSRNPIALIIPCHRVIGHDGKLVGYNGRLDIKSWLLDYEKNGNSRKIG
ncbi:Methylated-DNA--protein-cysteine methyltransferase, constitutive [Arsenophonus endosymbiont of Aleurodicus floccissimus]|uniref:methylated-DNA--[protein]-cysteine S-methyltransferase n=1 Tax=Arsenophonus endosymbiont of Aleurodicus floccissimus TaxID=2152761 RepID=UPI000E6B0D7C|nr:methylated-DNA--[protein]-cysteine S-methyltransferase [Arsenophonus endosymbiont of Aleurodicus floccissimus]SPP30911.1 Methylated-DNA--protein-cysteine methyltransferase, constitutive [Arsenophonus endosymbiont of Aleurodicus floccissimus]